VTSINLGSIIKLTANNFDLFKDIDLAISDPGPGAIDCRCTAFDSAGITRFYRVYSKMPASPGGEVVRRRSGGTSTFTFKLSKMPADVGVLVFSCWSDDGGSFSRGLTVTVSQGGVEPLSLQLAGAVLGGANAVKVITIYFDAGAWWLAVPNAPQSDDSAASAKGFSLATVPELSALDSEMDDVLSQLGIGGIAARVALVMDMTKSMDAVYSQGAAQKSVNMLVPLALRFDDREKVDLWFYAEHCQKMEPVDLSNYTTAVPKNFHKMRRDGLEYGNDEREVMDEVIEAFRAGKVPTMVIFLTDGDTSFFTDIQTLLKKSSKMPIFWQFIGLGKVHDLLPGCFAKVNKNEPVNNIGYFEFNDYDTISNEELYKRLMRVFPQWLQDARAKNIIV
jgi:stress response protein SCP2